MQTPSASDPSFKAFLDKLKEQNGGGILAQKETTKGVDKTNESLDELKDETSSVRDSLREGLHDVSDDVIEVQDQLDAANDSLSEIATAIIGSKESIDMEMLGALEGIKEAVTGIKLDIDLSELKAAIENIGYDVGKDLDSGGLAATISGIGMNTTKLQDEQLKELSLTRKLTEGSVEYDKEAAQYRNTSGRDVESKVSGKTSKDGGFIDFETARDTLSGQGERAKKENKVKLITGVTTTRSGVKPGDATAKALGADLGSLGPADPVTKPISVDPVSADPVTKPISPRVVPERNTSIKRARRERGSVTGDVDPKKGEGEELDRSLLGRIKDSAKFFMTDGLSEKNSKEVVKKERETKVSSPRQENPEADNISSTGEIQADAAKSDLELSKQMLDTTREQLTVLKEIKNALSPATPKEITEQKSAPSSTGEKEAVEGGGGKGLMDVASQALDLIPGGGKGKAAGKAAGMGGKILGGLGKAARFLGPAAAIAGAAYSGFEGYQNTGANFDLKEGEEATTGQKISSTLGGVVSGATFGLLDEKSASQGIHKAGSAVKDFFGFGDKEKPSDKPGDSKVTDGGGSDLEALQAKRDKLAKQGPATDSPQSIKAHEGVLGSLDKAIEDKKNSKPSEGKLSEAKSVTPVGGAPAPSESEGKVNSLEAEATRLGIDPNQATGTYSGGALTKITDKVSGKEYPVSVPEESKARVQAASNLKVKTGLEVAQTSTENADMERDASGKGGANNTVVSNNVSSNNTTKIVPMKASPRPEYTGSSLDRYTSRITVY